jgi:hypothetical protein
MNINVRSLSDLSDAERDELRATLAWMLNESGGQWHESDWCVTFENSAMTLSFLLQPGIEPLGMADEVWN